MDRQNIGKAYGDPVRKINNWKQSNNRDAQLVLNSGFTWEIQ